MKLCMLTVVATILLSGCGLAETTSVATTQAASSAEQVKQGKEMEEKVKRDIDAAQQAAADARDKAEAASE